MEGAAELRVPLVVDLGFGPNWAAGQDRPRSSSAASAAPTRTLCSAMLCVDRRRRHRDRVGALGRGRGRGRGAGAAPGRHARRAPVLRLGRSDRFFLLMTRDLFGTGHGFAAARRGRRRFRTATGAWAFRSSHGCSRSGSPALVGWALIAVNLAALTAIPGSGGAAPGRAPRAADRRRVHPRAPGRSCCSTERRRPIRSSSRCSCSRISSTARGHRRSALVVHRVRHPRQGGRGPRVGPVAVARAPTRAIGAWRSWSASAVAAVRRLVRLAAVARRRASVPSRTPVAHGRARAAVRRAPARARAHRPPDSAVILTMAIAVIALGAAGAWVARGGTRSARSPRSITVHGASASVRTRAALHRRGRPRVVAAGGFRAPCVW